MEKVRLLAYYNDDIVPHDSSTRAEKFKEKMSLEEICIQDMILSLF